MPDVRNMQKDNKRFVDLKKVDTKEFELPETVFISDIEPKVFQGIILQCLSEIDGIALAEGNFIASILGRTGPEIASGIHSEQNNKTHSVSIKIEVNIRYNISIPEKAEEIQSKVVEEITRLTGLRVASIHVIFKNIIPLNQSDAMINRLETLSKSVGVQEDEYNDEF